MAHFSSRLFARRNRLGLSQSALAKLAGVSEGSVSAWERGLNAPQGRLLEKLAATLNVSVPWLMGGSHAEEVERMAAAEKASTPYSPVSDLRSRDLLARLAGLPADVREMAFIRFDQVLAELMRLHSPPPYDGLEGGVYPVPVVDDAVLAAVDELMPHAIREAVRRERAAQPIPPTAMPSRSAAPYSTKPTPTPREGS